MAGNTFFVDTNSIKEHLTGLIIEGFDKVMEQINTALSVHKKDGKEADTDIVGLRAQITANVEILLPIIGSKSGMSSKRDSWDTAPNVHVITVGEAPNITAHALKGPTTCCDTFLIGDAGATPAAALRNLLVLTQKMLKLHISDIGKLPKLPPAVEEAWSSDIVTTPGLREGYMVSTGLFDECDIGVEKYYY